MLIIAAITLPVEALTCHSSSVIKDIYFRSFSIFLCRRYSTLVLYGQVTSMIMQWLFSSTVVISGFTNSVPSRHDLPVCTFLFGCLIFNSFPILHTNQLCLSWISFLFISSFYRILWPSSASEWHWRHFFSSIPVRPPILFIFVSRVDERAWIHLILLLTLNQLTSIQQEPISRVFRFHHCRDCSLVVDLT